MGLTPSQSVSIFENIVHGPVWVQRIENASVCCFGQPHLGDPALHVPQCVHVLHNIVYVFTMPLLPFRTNREGYSLVLDMLRELAAEVLRSGGLQSHS